MNYSDPIRAEREIKSKINHNHELIRLANQAIHNLEISRNNQLRLCNAGEEYDKEDLDYCVNRIREYKDLINHYRMEISNLSSNLRKVRMNAVMMFNR